MNYENFVFYGSWRETLEGFKEDFGEEYAREALWNLMLLATAGDIETQKKSILGFLHGAVMPNVNAAKDRYAAAVENGKKGGRPKVELDETEVMQKKQELKTWKAVAAYYGVSDQTLKNKRNEWEQAKNVKNPKNLDIDIDIDKDKEKELENEILCDGWVEKDKTFIDNLYPHFWSLEQQRQKDLLRYRYNYTDKEADYIVRNILS